MTDNFGEIDRTPNVTQIFLDGYNAVSSYNDQHLGRRGVTFAAMMEEYRMSQPGYVKPDNTPMDEAERARDRVIEDQQDSLAELGIKLDVQPPALAYDPLTGGVYEDKTNIPSMIAMKIGDAELFGVAIERLNPVADQEKLVGSGVNEILENELRGIKDIYRGLTGDDEASKAFQRHDAETQMEALIDLNPVLMAKGYGTDELRHELAACMIRHQDNTLEEYVRAEDMGLLSPNGGATGWILYMDEASLEASWLAAIDLLRNLRDKEGSSDFYPELFAKVKGDFNQTLAMLQSDDYRAALTVGVDPESRMQSLDGVAKRLSEIWANDFTLESLFHFEADKPGDETK